MAGRSVCGRRRESGARHREGAADGAADAYRAKYGDDWDFDCNRGVFDPNSNRAYVFLVPVDKVITLAKSPQGQTTFRFAEPR